MELQQRYEKAEKILSQCSQSHLLQFYNELSDSSKSSLLSQIEQLEFDNLDSKIAEYVLQNTPPQLPADFTAAKSAPAVAETAEQKQKYSQAVKLGTELISSGKVACFVVAGGQGTRLGFNGPKGNFPTSPIKKKTLFRLFAEQIKAAGRKYGFSPVWYVMLSPLNYAATKDIFENDDYYGLPKQDIFFFQQGTEVNYSMDGKILLSDKDTIATSPDGHGGSLKALYKSGAVADMQRRGIEILSYFQVDNPLINIFDPLFVGLHAMEQAQMSSKSLLKSSPFEKVGNFCISDGRVMVIEYSDLPDRLAEKRNSDGSLVFADGSIAIHIINRTFIEQLNSKGFALKYHRAVKKIPFIDSSGKKIIPSEANGIKLETFVFDALPLAECSVILETLRAQEFAPVKNAQGTDSPEITKQMLTARAADWLEAAGVEVPKNDGRYDCVIEMAASYALHKEDVISKKPELKISAGQQLYLE